MPSPRRSGLMVAVAFLLTAITACSSGSSADGLASDSPLPTEIPAGTTLYRYFELAVERVLLTIDATPAVLRDPALAANGRGLHVGVNLA